MPVFEYLRSKRPAFFFGLSTALILLIGVPDYLLGHTISLSIFYLIPILLAAWFSGKAAGLYAAFLSAGIWFAADELAGFEQPYLLVWDAAVRLGFFLVVVFLVAAFRREQVSARKDVLTGLGNRRDFFERAGAEIKRSQRYGHPFTVAYIDVDDFKSVNDRFGHDAGDALLQSVGSVIGHNIRATDISARLGGDEFAVLLPESGAEQATDFFGKLHRLLSGAGARGRAKVTFSIGVVTFLRPPASPDEMIRTVDGLMYAAKEAGKNQVRYHSV